MSSPLILAGAAIGLVCGMASGFVVSIVALRLRALENARLARRGEPQPRNLVRLRLEVAGALLGGLGGAIAGPIAGARTAAIVAAALPLLLVVLVALVGWMVVLAGRPRGGV